MLFALKPTRTRLSWTHFPRSGPDAPAAINGGPEHSPRPRATPHILFSYLLPVVPNKEQQLAQELEFTQVSNGGGELPVHLRVRERGPPRQALRPGLRRGPRRLPRSGPRQQGGLRDLHQDQHGDGVRRDHHEGERRLREDRARHLPQHRVHLRRRRPGRRPLQGAGEHRAAVARHRAGRARALHEAARGDRRGRPGAHVRVRDRRDPRADAAEPRAGHEARRAADRGPEERHLRVAEARRQDPGHRGVRERGRRHGPRPRAHGPHLHAARRDRHQRRDRGRPQGARHQAGDPGEVPRREDHLPPEPVRPLRDRWPPRRRRSHRPQDHHRHLRWLGSPRRRRLLRQGPHEGGPQRRVHRQAGGEEHRCRRPRSPLHRAGVVRHRRAGAPIRVRGLLRHRQDPRQGDPQDREGELRLQARHDHHQPRPEEGRQQVHQDRRVRPLRPRRRRLHLGGGEAPQVRQGVRLISEGRMMTRSCALSVCCALLLLGAPAPGFVSDQRLVARL